MNKNSISLSKFLSRYLGLCGEQLKELTHDDVKVLFPNLKRSSFEKIENNPELLYDQEIILVNDGHKTIPYIVPDTIVEEISEVNCIRQIEEKNIDNNIYDYSKLSTYELKLLLRHAFNSYRNQRMAKQELFSRGIIKKKYNRNEFKKIYK